MEKEIIHDLLKKPSGISFLTDFLLPLLGDEKITKKKNNPELYNLIKSSDYQYIIKSLQKYMEVHKLLINLNQILFFISNIKISKKMSKNNIDERVLITYHTENFYFRVTGILDRVLAMLNCVYKLEIISKATRFNVILDDKGKIPAKGLLLQEKNPTIYILLVNLSNVVNDFRLMRNDVAHQTTYNDSNSEILGIVNFINIAKKNEIEARNYQPTMDDFINRILLKSIKEQKDYFKKTLTNIIEVWNKMNDEIEKEFAIFMAKVDE